MPQGGSGRTTLWTEIPVSSALQSVLPDPRISYSTYSPIHSSLFSTSSLPTYLPTYLPHSHIHSLTFEQKTGKQIQFGNNVPFSKTKTRRTWLPNVQTKRLFSETLNDWIRLNMTTSVIRTVDKKGGLDRYLLETRPDLLGEKGVELRGKIVEVLKIKQAEKLLENAHKLNITNTTTLNSSTAPVNITSSASSSPAVPL